MTARDPNIEDDVRAIVARIVDGILGANGSGEGWVTGEYAMLPAATDRRRSRELNTAPPTGRAREILAEARATP